VKRLANKLLRLGLRSLPPAVMPTLLHRRAVGLFYHLVSDQPAPHIKHIYTPIAMADFEAHLTYIKTHYRVISYRELVDARRTGCNLPPRSLHLSFDDGFRECFHVARPALLSHGLPCTFFLVTDWIDNHSMYFRNQASLCLEQVAGMSGDEQVDLFREVAGHYGISVKSFTEFSGWLMSLRHDQAATVEAVTAMAGVDVFGFLQDQQPFMTEREIRQMQAEGFTIGAHSRTHRKLDDLPKEAVEAEIAGSCQMVAELTSEAQVPFSFPHSAGRLPRAWLADIRSRNPQVGLLFDTRGMQKDVEFIYNRIWAEHPGYAAQTVDKIIQNAYLDYLWQAGGGDKERSV
jgi:peptidoglycan/xylan/chitin deacetylase (PgdA/CDA1 family)